MKTLKKTFGYLPETGNKETGLLSIQVELTKEETRKIMKGLEKECLSPSHYYNDPGDTMRERAEYYALYKHLRKFAGL
jgi:hypothetical protein